MSAAVATVEAAPEDGLPECCQRLQLPSHGAASFAQRKRRLAVVSAALSED